MVGKTGSIDERYAEWFWSKVDRSNGADSCWPWMGPRSRGGYGRVRFDGQSRNAQRAAWVVANGPIPKGDGHHGTCVLHRCDNRPCCNPAHLWLGSNAENVADRDRKGRQVAPKGDAHGSCLHPERRVRGEAVGLSRLTDAIIPDIFRAAEGGETHRSIALRLGVGKATITRVLSRHTWRHVAIEPRDTP